MAFGIFVLGGENYVINFDESFVALAPAGNDGKGRRGVLVSKSQPRLGLGLSDCLMNLTNVPDRTDDDEDDDDDDRGDARCTRKTRRQGSQAHDLRSWPMCVRVTNALTLAPAFCAVLLEGPRPELEGLRFGREDDYRQERVLGMRTRPHRGVSFRYKNVGKSAFDAMSKANPLAHSAHRPVKVFIAVVRIFTRDMFPF